MLTAHLRQAATALLDSAIRIAPPDSREWGRAMRNELNQVEGSWAAVMWAFGGASVLAKRALAALLIPGRRGQNIPLGSGLFAKDVSIRNAALAAGAVCVAASLLFFAAPPFRQALRVALSQWIATLGFDSSGQQPELLVLARRAEQRHDAEGLAFCAVRLENPRESARLAEEAVRVDPNLFWVYAVLAIRHPDLPEISQWLARLDRWDPQNALIPMISAEAGDISHEARGDIRTRGDEKDPVWQNAMAAAFRSPKFEDYLDRVEALDRKVVLRYRFYNPEDVLGDADQGMPTYALEDLRIFASSVIRAGQELEARGDTRRATENYWSVARFGQLIDAQGHTSDERSAGATLQAMAYKRLQALYQKQGNVAEATLFGYLTAKFRAVSQERGRFGGLIFRRDTYMRNAAVVMASGLLMLIFCGLLAVTTTILIVGRRRGARPGASTARPVAAVVAMASALGLLLSSATLYLTYRPYWYIFQDAILNGDRDQARSLRAFLDSTRMVPGVRAPLPAHDQVYFWAGVTSLAVCGLVLILLRHFRPRTRLNQPQPHPRVP